MASEIASIIRASSNTFVIKASKFIVPKNTLRTNLERLHRELSSAHSMDAETRVLLARIAEDIEQVLAEAPPEDGGLTERLENATVRFEASHPNLARALNEMTDALTKLGI